jgi:cysteine desulfurase
MSSIKYYFDYAATTPLDPRVLKAMKPYFSHEFGNPGSIHEAGRKAKEAIEKAAAKIASILHCRPQEFIFTGSATEADNLAVFGIAKANTVRGLKRSSSNSSSQPTPNGASKTAENKIIISAVEHKAILAPCQTLAEEGFEIIKLKVDKNGLVDPNDVAKLLDSKTILVSIIYADNETGTIQPIKEIAKVIKKFRASHSTSLPYFHTDASQAAQYLDINVEKLGVDLMTVSSHKLYGPKGIGGLYIRKGVRIKPIIFGGGQQNNIRPGTENVPSIVGFAEALALAESNKQKEYKRLEKLRNELEQGIFKSIPKVFLNGHPQKRLPNFLNVSILDIEGEAALLYLDQKGICTSTGSACDSQSLEPSHAILALGRPREYAHGSLRFTLGKYTTRESIQYLLKHLPPIVEKLRQMSPINIKVSK